MRNLSCKRIPWLAALVCAAAFALSACGGRGVSKDLLTQAANIPASFDVTLIADKDNQFDYDGAPLTEEDLRSALRYRKDQNLPVATVIVKRPGYAKVILEPGPTKGPLEIVMRPHVIKAAYLTYFGFGDRGIRGRVVDMLERTELNAVVIDVKGDRGWIIYPTRVEQALAIGAQGPATLRDFDGMMADGLHPTAAAYQIWADALKPILRELLGPPSTVDLAPPPTGDPAAAKRDRFR